MRDLPTTLGDAASALRAGELTSTELTRTALERADALDGALGVYLARFDEAALAAAARADADFARGVDRGPLQGIPVGVKDIVAVADGPTTAQSLVLDRQWGAGADAPIVRRLRAAGAVLAGKTSTMEFAVGVPDPTKPFPVPRNPWDVRTWPGGSSSGTGAGVAAGLFLAGIGSDTGGSIRIPAAYCGVSGLMPTFGRVPKSGCVPLGFSLDHVGPLARSAWDCAAMLDVLAGFDPSDPDCVDRPVPGYVAALDAGGDLDGVRVGVQLEHHFPEMACAELADQFDAALTALAERGATLVQVAIPHYPEVMAAAIVTMYGEAMAYHQADLRARWGDFFAGTRGTVPVGALVSAADYVQAQRVRRLGQRALAGVFDDVDVIAMPTCGDGAPVYGGPAHDRLTLSSDRGTIFTPYWDAVGNPVLAVPMGFTGAGLPLSLQLAGRPFEEAVVLRVGHAFQQTTSWHRCVPDVVAGRAGDAVGAGAGAGAAGGTGSAGAARGAAAGAEGNGRTGAAATPGGGGDVPFAAAIDTPLDAAASDADARAAAEAELAAGGLPASDEETAALATASSMLRSAVAATYALAGIRDEVPALRFDAVVRPARSWRDDG